MSLAKLIGIDQEKAVAALSDEVEELLGDMTLAEYLEKYGNEHQVGFSVSIKDNAVTGAVWIEPKKKE